MVENEKVKLKKGARLKVDVNYLHPTQFTVGMLQVNKKKRKIDNCDKKKLAKWLRSKTVPVVIGPSGTLFMIDRHHAVRALSESKYSFKKIHIKIKKDLSHLPKDEFWNKMVKKRWTWLFKNGEPLDADNLPAHISELKDDPFRSLAANVRGKKGFKKSGPFSEFIWADFLRKRIAAVQLNGFQEGGDMHKQILDLAIKLCLSSEASGLPGWKGKTPLLQKIASRLSSEDPLSRQTEHSHAEELSPPSHL
jgi:hypothetical protein